MNFSTVYITWSENFFPQQGSQTHKITRLLLMNYINFGMLGPAFSWCSGEKSNFNSHLSFKANKP